MQVYKIILVLLIVGESFAYGGQKQGTLVLTKNALSASGQAQYEIDSKGTMRVWGQAKSWLLGVYKFDDKYDVDPKNLRSDSFVKVDSNVPFDGLTLNVVQVDSDKGKSVAKGLSKNGWVTFYFDISDEIVDLEAILFEGQVLPIELKLIRKT